MSICRSCGAPILWGVTDQGRRMPLDPTAMSEGVRFTFTEGVLIERVEGELFGHVSHFATCPNAAEHRRPR